MKKLYGLEVNGYTFCIWIEEKYVDGMRADGLVLDEVINAVPEEWTRMGLPLHYWTDLQDIGLLPMGGDGHFAPERNRDGVDKTDEY